MFRIERYQPDHKGLWNKFVANSKNGVFLFDRDYLEYHADRFVDHSLMFWENDKLLALLPATERDGVLSSHGGLTFGGVITDQRMRTSTMLQVFEQLRTYLQTNKLIQLLYKAVPHIYHRLPAEEDLYALFVQNTRLIRRDVSSAIHLQERVEMTHGRKQSLRRAKSEAVEVSESQDFQGFMAIEEANLRQKYNVRPTHTAAELELLAARFPQNIKLFVGSKGGSLLGGVVIYQSRRVAHAQYIATTDEGRELGCMDAVFDVLLPRLAQEVAYFDFGISTEQQGRFLNVGLNANKESFGARAVVYDFYELAA